MLNDKDLFINEFITSLFARFVYALFSNYVNSNTTELICSACEFIYFRVQATIMSRGLEKIENIQNLNLSSAKFV